MFDDRTPNQPPAQHQEGNGHASAASNLDVLILTELKHLETEQKRSLAGLGSYSRLAREARQEKATRGAVDKFIGFTLGDRTHDSRISHYEAAQQVYTEHLKVLTANEQILRDAQKLLSGGQTQEALSRLTELTEVGQLDRQSIADSQAKLQNELHRIVSRGENWVTGLKAVDTAATVVSATTGAGLIKTVAQKAILSGGGREAVKALISRSAHQTLSEAAEASSKQALSVSQRLASNAAGLLGGTATGTAASVLTETENAAVRMTRDGDFSSSRLADESSRIAGAGKVGALVSLQASAATVAAIPGVGAKALGASSALGRFGSLSLMGSTAGAKAGLATETIGALTGQNSYRSKEDLLAAGRRLATASLSGTVGSWFGSLGSALRYEAGDFAGGVGVDYLINQDEALTTENLILAFAGQTAGRYSARAQRHGTVEMFPAEHGQIHKLSSSKQAGSEAGHISLAQQAMRLAQMSRHQRGMELRTQLRNSITNQLRAGEQLDTAYLAVRLATEPAETVLGVVSTLEELGASLAGDTDSAGAARNILDSISTIGSYHDSPPIEAAVSLATRKIKADLDVPFSYFIGLEKVRNLERVFRLSKVQQQQVAELSRQISLEDRRFENRPLRVADDAIVLLDKDFRPQALAQLNFASLPSELPRASVGEIDKMLAALKDLDSSHQSESFQLLHHARTMAGEQRTRHRLTDSQILSMDRINRGAEELDRLESQRFALLSTSFRLHQSILAVQTEVESRFVNMFEAAVNPMSSSKLPIATVRYLLEYSRYKENNHTVGQVEMARRFVLELRKASDSTSSFNSLAQELERALTLRDASHAWITDLEIPIAEWVNHSPFDQGDPIVDAIQEIVAGRKLLSQTDVPDSGKEFESIPEVAEPAIRELRDLFVNELTTLRHEVVNSLAKVSPKALQDATESLALFPFGAHATRDNIALLQEILSPVTRESICERLGIDRLQPPVKLEQLPIRSQLHLLRYSLPQNTAHFERVRNAVSRHPNAAEDLLYSFLAHAEDPRYSQSVLRLAEAADSETASVVFNKYAEITKETGAIERQLESEPQFAELPADTPLAISRFLIKKANRILEETSEKISSNPEKASEIVARLDRAHVEVFVAGVAMRRMAELYRDRGEHFDVKSISGYDVDARHPSSFSDAERAIILDIARENTINNPYYKKEVAESYFGSLQSALSNPKPETQFWLLTAEVDGEKQILSFLRQEATPSPDTSYLGSFNTDPFLRGSGIGFRLFDDVIGSLGSLQNLIATSDPNTPALSLYKEMYGFEAESETPLFPNGPPQIPIRRPRSPGAESHGESRQQSDSGDSRGE